MSEESQGHEHMGVHVLRKSTQGVDVRLNAMPGGAAAGI